MHKLVVDGYNVIHAWPALKTVLETGGLEDARRQLIAALAEYAARSGVAVIVVFDAKSGGPGSVESIDGITVRFATRDASADHVIERMVGDASRHGGAHDIVVVTGDRLQRAIVGGLGAATMSPGVFEEEVARLTRDMAQTLRHRGADAAMGRRIEHHLSPEMLRKLEALRRAKPSEAISGDAASPDS